MKDQQHNLCQHDSSAIVTVAPGAPVCQHVGTDYIDTMSLTLTRWVIIYQMRNEENVLLATLLQKHFGCRSTLNSTLNPKNRR